MLLLADENFPRSTVEALRRDAHDVIWVSLQRPKPISRCGVMLIRLHPAVAKTLTPLARKALKSVGEGWRGQISVVTTDGIRLIAARRQP